MANDDLIVLLGLDPMALEDKKEQTTKKIQYVRAYVENWLYVMTAQPRTTSITFIDAMSNAGIYRDGGLGTAAEVAKLFARFAPKSPHVDFRIYVNDIDRTRVETCCKVCDYFIPNKVDNLTIVHANLDVNSFLLEAAHTHKVPQGYGNAILLFVDPYNARVVHLNSMIEFIKSRYCEIIFNWFSSDLKRNKNDPRIIDCFDGLDIQPDEDAADAISGALRIGKMKYVFGYAFRISTNAELYQIIFVTPNLRGLEKLKDALWNTFHGALYHQNTRPALACQPRLFGDDLLEDSTADACARSAREALVAKFRGCHDVPYKDIDAFLLERTMLKEGKIIELVIKPLIKDGLLIKTSTGRGYKGGLFTFTGRPATISHL